VKKKIIFTGRVQGVGFRWTVTRIASGYDVTGYVKNRSDGTVEVVAQGNGKAVDAFVDEIAETMKRYISRVDVQPYLNEEIYPTFTVAH